MRLLFFHILTQGAKLVFAKHEFSITVRILPSFPEAIGKANLAGNFFEARKC